MFQYSMHSRIDVKQRPVPQYNFKAAGNLVFGDDHGYEQYKDGLKLWLAKKWQMDINDPKLAIGLIPLGRLIGDFDVERIGKSLETHTIIESVEILDATTLVPHSHSLTVFSNKGISLSVSGRAGSNFSPSSKTNCIARLCNVYKACLNSSCLPHQNMEQITGKDILADKGTKKECYSRFLYY